VGVAAGVEVRVVLVVGVGDEAGVVVRAESVAGVGGRMVAHT
jgi:hypothetical protein